MNSKKDKKKPIWLRDDIWNDTPDIDEINKIEQTKAYQQLKSHLDKIHKQNRKKHNKAD